jgi:hypothetical protein
MMHNRFRRRKADPTKYLSATFKNGRGSFGASSIVTLDEALAAIEHKNKSREASAFRDKDAPKRGVRSIAQAQALADVHARQATKRGKIKMPEFSIQKIE